jgi:C1A family cysteine protease
MFKKYKYLTHIVFLSVSVLLADALPSRFDLRNVDGISYVSLVRQQQGGTCWTHGTMASIESNMMRTGLWNSAVYFAGPDLSEYHLDWWNGFNQFFNQDLGFYPSVGLAVHMGGDYRVATAYLSRGDGAVTNEDAPLYKSAGPRSDTSFTYYYPRNVEWYHLKDDLSNIDFIKQKIMEYGAMGTCMYASDEFLDDSTNGSFYQPPSDPRDPNHSIAIVGWDDTISTAAPAPGAWLCKNSWGSDWGAAWDGHGYFWISYYDKHAGRNPEMGCVSFQDVELMKYDSVYYHDYHGWRDTLDVREAANIFVATARDTVVAVSFFAAADSVNYTVGIFRNKESLKETNHLLTQSGSVPHAGFHTVDLDDKVVLMKGDSFYVYLSLDKGGQPYDRTSEIPVLLDVPPLYRSAVPALTVVPSTASPNQSIFKQNGSWHDLQTVNTSANFCIKALVKKGKFSLQTPAPESSELLSVHPNPVNGRVIIDYQLQNASNVNILLYDILGRPVRTLLDQDETPGYHWTEYNVSDLSSGIYICTFKIDGVFKESRKILVVK